MGASNMVFEDLFGMSLSGRSFQNPISSILIHKGNLFSFASKQLCLSLRGAFFVTEQAPNGQSGLINGRLLRRKTARNDMTEWLLIKAQRRKAT
jgi:hypothetical protein